MSTHRKLTKKQRERVLGLLGEQLDLADPDTFEIRLSATAEDTVGVMLKDRWVQQPLRVDRKGMVLYPVGDEWVPRAGGAQAQLA
jgi:hypothetical protein